VPEYSDIYVISNKRDALSVESFLECFLPQREESAEEYEVPQYSNTPTVTFTSAFELMAFCAKKQSESYVVYWRALNEMKPEHGMVFYLRDGNVIYGLSTDAAEQNYARKLLQELKAFLGSSLGYIAHEASPDADCLEEFETQVELHKT
jgi:hypothetical protein